MTIPENKKILEEKHDERIAINRILAQKRTRLWNQEIEEKERVYDLQQDIVPKDAEEAIQYVREFYNPGAEEFEDPNVFRTIISKIEDPDTGEVIAADLGFIRKPLSLWRVPPGLGAKAQASKLRNMIEYLEDSYFRLKNVQVKEEATRGNDMVFVGQGLAYNKQMELDASPNSNQIKIYLDSANAIQFKKAAMNLEFEQFYPIAKMEDYPLDIPNNALSNAMEDKLANDLLVAGLLQNADDNIRSYDHQYALANVGKTLQNYTNEKDAKYKLLAAIRADIAGQIQEAVLEDKATQNAVTKDKLGKLTNFKTKINTAIKAKYDGFKEILGNMSYSEKAVTTVKTVMQMIGHIPMALTFLNSETIKAPEAIFGPALLYSTQMIERAKSDRKLKNRALGDVFLAHQKGNSDIVRIDGTLTGPQRFIMLALLLKLQKDGEGFVTDLSKYSGIVFDPTAPPASAEVQKSEKQQLNYEEHRTLPLVTRTHIMLNMYLQTIEWHRSVEDGQDTIKYHLLFRKHIPSTAWRAFNPQKYTNDEGKPVAGAGYQLLDQRAQARRWLEFSLDLAWKIARTVGEVHLHMLINSGGQQEHEVHQGFQDVSNVVTGYQGKILGVF